MSGREAEPTRAEVDGMPGFVVLEFGATWCGHCRATRPRVDANVRRHPEVRYLWIEDGPGQPLGRSFQVKLWPTLVFMHDGKVVNRLVRPTPQAIDDAFVQLTDAAE